VKRALLVDIGREDWEVEEQRIERREKWISVIG
jgi:hypothetical protein